MAAKLEKNTFLHFVTLYLFVALHLAPAYSVYKYIPFTYGTKLTATMEEERNTYKYTATKGRMELSVSGMKQDGFVKVIWQTENGDKY